MVDEYWVTKGGQQKREDVFLEIKDFKPSQGSRPPAKKSSESTSQAKKRKEDTLSESSPAKKKKKQNEPGKAHSFSC